MKPGALPDDRNEATNLADRRRHQLGTGLPVGDVGTVRDGLTASRDDRRRRPVASTLKSLTTTLAPVSREGRNVGAANARPRQ